MKYVNFSRPGWSLAPIPVYGLPFFEVGARKDQLQHILRFLSSPMMNGGKEILIGVVKAEWGYGKTHLFLHLIKKILEEKKIDKVDMAKALPIYMEFDDLVKMGILQLRAEGNEGNREFCNILFQASMSAIKKYEDSYQIPYSEHTKDELYKLISTLKDEDATEIFGEIMKYYDRIYIFLDEVESAVEYKDEGMTALFLRLVIKDFLERKLPIRENVTLLMGCSTPIWDTFMTYFGEIIGRYIRREYIYELEPITSEDAFSFIDQAVKLGGIDQENPFGTYTIQALWRASLGSPFNLLNLYAWISRLALEKSAKGKIQEITYEEVFEGLKGREVPIAEGKTVPAVDPGVLKRFEELFMKPEDYEVLRLFVGEYGLHSVDQIADKLRTTRDETFKKISEANRNCIKAFNRPLFSRYKILSLKEEYELRRALREINLLSEEGEIFGMRFEVDFYPKISLYMDGRARVYSIPTEEKEFQDLMGLEFTEELRRNFEKMRDFLEFEPETYYRLSSFADRRVFPSPESKLYVFIRSYLRQREAERRVEEIFYDKPEEFSRYVKSALSKLFELFDEKWKNLVLKEEE